VRKVIKKTLFLPPKMKGCRKAEITPIEPDPDNAGVGRNHQSFL